MGSFGYSAPSLTLHLLLPIPSVSSLVSPAIHPQYLSQQDTAATSDLQRLLLSYLQHSCSAYLCQMPQLSRITDEFGNLQDRVKVCGSKEASKALNCTCLKKILVLLCSLDGLTSVLGQQHSCKHMYDVNAHNHVVAAGLLFFELLFLSFRQLFVALFTFPDEFKMLLKERASGMYRLSAFYFARTASDLPMDMAIPTLFLLLVYFMGHLRYTAAAFFANFFTVILVMLVWHCHLGHGGTAGQHFA